RSCSAWSCSRNRPPKRRAMSLPTSSRSALRRADSATLKPSAASWRANSAPMPEDAPVTSAHGPYRLAKLEIPSIVRVVLVLSGGAEPAVPRPQPPGDQRQGADQAWQGNGEWWVADRCARERSAGGVEYHAGIGPLLEPRQSRRNDRDCADQLESAQHGGEI